MDPIRLKAAQLLEEVCKLHDEKLVDAWRHAHTKKLREKHHVELNVLGELKQQFEGIIRDESDRTDK